MTVSSSTLAMRAARRLPHALRMTGLALCGLAAAACSTLDAPAPRVDASLPDAPTAWTMAQERVGDVEVGWIEAFDDPRLTALVIEAQSNNKSLQVAAANVERARLVARQAGAALRPSVDLVANAAESGLFEGDAANGFNPLIPFQTVGAQLQWEIDVWGRIRSANRAARAGAESAEADYLFSQYSIAAGVASAYFVAIEAVLQKDIAQRTVDALAESARIASVRFDNGVASSQDVALVRSDLSTAQNALEEIEGAERDALRALEILLGRYPAADVEVRTSLPAPPPAPPAGVPSEILERRPDIIAAERNVAAAFNRVREAKAARLPRLSLTSSVGGASNSLSDILNPENVAWSVLGNLMAPIFDGGARRLEVEIRTAEHRQALAQYAEVALVAFGEVETALDQGAVLSRRYAFLDDAVREANEAFRVARARYDSGETDLIDLLTIQQRVTSAESNLASVQRLLLTQRIDLNLALGGDWR